MIVTEVATRNDNPTSGELTDVISKSVAISGSTYGQVSCDDAIGTTAKCDQHDMKMDVAQIAGWSTFKKKKTGACHELGHTVGLKHGGQAANYDAPNPPIPGADNDVHLRCLRDPLGPHAYLGDHNKAWVNHFY